VVDLALAPGVPGFSSYNFERILVVVHFFKRKTVCTLTSFVFKLGVDRDELDPDLEGGRSLLAGFKIFVADFSPFLSPFKPILSLSRDSADSPLGRGEGEPWSKKRNHMKS
jgi:hypothetical protein